MAAHCSLGVKVSKLWVAYILVIVTIQVDGVLLMVSMTAGLLVTSLMGSSETMAQLDAGFLNDAEPPTMSGLRNRKWKDLRPRSVEWALWSVVSQASLFPKSGGQPEPRSRKPLWERDRWMVTQNGITTKCASYWLICSFHRGI